jgi:parallel beta-helix repeat protein
MSRSRRATTGLSVLALGLTGLVTSAGPAAANHIGCNAKITTNVTLDSDVGPCTTDGLDITASNITVDLNGKRVFSTNAKGDIAGIRLLGVSNVTVKNGTVQGFNDGVAIMGGGGNTVQNVTAINNVSDYGGGVTNPATSECAFGDGIGLFDTNDNNIVGNTANSNGPYGGISLVGHSSRNQVIGNITNNNNLVATINGGRPTCPGFDNTEQDEGIRIEGPGSTNNNIQGNDVNRNLLAGIGIHAGNNLDPGADATPNTGNTIEGNNVRFNGNSVNDPSASGISILGTPGVRSFGTIIVGNVASNNAAHGIYLPAESHNNVVSGNLTDDNGRDGIFVEGPSFSNTFTNVGPSLLDLTQPDLPPYTLGTQFAVLSGSGSGNVTARVVPVGPIQIPPGAFDTAASGCSPADFVGFPAGSIALVQRGFCGRAQKVANARAAGAVGVIMFNEGTTGRTGVLTAGVDPTSIPVVGTSFAVGQQIYQAAQNGPVFAHIVTNTTNVQRQVGPGAENNTLSDNRGARNAEHDGHDANPACDANRWERNIFGTINQACVAANGGSGTVKP